MRGNLWRHISSESQRHFHIPQRRNSFKVKMQHGEAKTVGTKLEHSWIVLNNDSQVTRGSEKEKQSVREQTV